MDINAESLLQWLKAKDDYYEQLKQKSKSILGRLEYNSKCLILNEVKLEVQNRINAKLPDAKCAPASAKVKCDVPECGGLASFIIHAKARCFVHRNV